MNPSLPYVDLVFCLKFPVLNLTQRLLEEGPKKMSIIMSSRAFHSMGCMQDMWYVARSVGGSYIVLGHNH